MKDTYAMLLTLLPYLGSFMTSFADASVKTFQSKNIIAGNERLAFCTSWIVSAVYIANFGFLMVGGWLVFFPIGLGGAIGTVFAMRLHKRVSTKNGIGRSTRTV